MILEGQGADDTPLAEAEEKFLRRIQPELDQMEIIRQMKFDEYRRWQWLIWPVCIAAVAAGYALDYGVATLATKFFPELKSLFYLRSKKHGMLPYPVPLLAVAAGLGAYWRFSGAKGSYIQAYKENIVSQIAKAVGLSGYDPRGGIGPAMFASRICPPHDICKTEDFFEGEYEGAHVQFCQVAFSNSERRSRWSGGRRRSSTRIVPVFSGLALLVSMPQPICTGHTILVKDRSQFREWIAGITTGLKKVELGRLENIYTCFSNNAEEARQLVTADLLDRVTKLSQAYQSKGVSIAFYQSQMFVLIGSDRDFFEPPDIRTSAAHTGVVLSIRREITEVIGIIDYLTAPPKPPVEAWQGN